MIQTFHDVFHFTTNAKQSQSLVIAHVHIKYFPITIMTIYNTCKTKPKFGYCTRTYKTFSNKNNDYLQQMQNKAKVWLLHVLIKHFPIKIMII